MRSLKELQKIIAEKRDSLNLAIKNNESQDVLYQ